MDLETYYEVARVSEFIRSHGFTRATLQFPYEDFDEVTDTTYGSCCVDEVGEAHVNAQCILHYGHTCLSPTSTLPASFIFGKDSISTED